MEGRGYDPAKAEARAQMDVNPSKLGSVAIDRGRFDVALAAGRAKIAKASLHAKGATLDASGDVGVDPNARGQLAYDLSVADLQPWLELAGQQGGGALAVKGTANGTLSSLAANGRVQAKELRVATASVGGADVTYTARDLGRPEPQGRVTASLQNVEAGTAVRDLKADVTLREKGRFSAELNATDAASRAHHLAGEGRLETPDVEFQLADLSLGSSQGPWRIVRPASFVFRRRVLTISGFDLANGDRHVRLGGSVAPRGPTAAPARDRSFHARYDPAAARRRTEDGGPRQRERRGRGYGFGADARGASDDHVPRNRRAEVRRRRCIRSLRRPVR